MEYIMISMLTITIFTYVVYVLANKMLAIRMHLKFLVLCACCAFSMSLILPRLFVGIAGLTGTLCIIILFGLISSYFIARYYDAELQKASLKNALIPIAVEIPDIIKPDQQDFLPSTPTIFSFEMVQEPTENLEIITEPESISKEVFYPVEYKEQSEDWKVMKVENIAQLPIEENIPDVAEVVIKEYLYPAAYKEKLIFSDLEKSHEETLHEMQEENVEKPSDTPVKNEEEIEVSNELMAVKNEEIYEEVAVGHQEISFSEETPIMESSDLAEVPEEVTSEELCPSSTDLDVLMDIAFLQKEQHKFLQALITFRRALFLYPNSEVSPFLVIEIGTILKNLGSYNEAIQVFTEGRLLSGVINNMSLDQEFINNIAYLRVVKNILIKNSLEFAPLNQISSETLKEINDEFSEWRSQS